MKFGGGHIAYYFVSRLNDRPLVPWNVKKHFYLLEVQQYGYPGDEDKKFCMLCLIDVSIIVIHVLNGPFDLWYHELFMTEHQNS